MDTTPTATDPTTIEREVRIAARPETVFPYFVDPARITRWMGRTAELDPRPGGRFRIDYNGEDIASGEYLEVDPPRRVVFTWGWEAPGDPLPPGGSTVAMELTAEYAAIASRRLKPCATRNPRMRSRLGAIVSALTAPSMYCCSSPGWDVNASWL